MHQYVVVFIFTFSLDLLEIFHRHRPFLLLIGHRLHMIDEGLTEVFRYIFGISFDEVPPIFRGFKEQAKFLALSPLDLGWILLVRLVGVPTILAGRYKGSLFPLFCLCLATLVLEGELVLNNILHL